MRRTPMMLLIATLVLTACSSVDSADIRTNGMKADIVVWVGEGSSDSQVEVSLRVGTVTFVDLGDGEKLTARSGDTSIKLDKGNLLGITGYGGRLKGINQPGTEVVVDLQRTSNDTSAPDSKVRLAEPIAFAAPESGATFSRSRDAIAIRIESDAAPQGAQLAWAGDCVVGGGLDLAPGQKSLTVGRGMIRNASRPSGTPGPTTCKVTLTLTRRLPGTLDPAFGGGSIVAESRSTRDITSTP